MVRFLSIFNGCYKRKVLAILYVYIKLIGNAHVIVVVLLIINIIFFKGNSWFCLLLLIPSCIQRLIHKFHWHSPTIMVKTWKRCCMANWKINTLHRTVYPIKFELVSNEYKLSGIPSKTIHLELKWIWI